jgi:tetratricopeptide (TPR) repeat protein
MSEKSTRCSLKDFLGLTSTHLDAIAVLGSNLYEQGRLSEAATIFEGLLALDGNNYYGHAGMGALALSEEKLDEALQYLKTASRLNPNDPTVHANLGETLFLKAQFKEAAVELEMALKLNPDGRDPGANRARGILQGVQAAMNEADLLNKLPATANA